MGKHVLVRVPNRRRSALWGIGLVLSCLLMSAGFQEVPAAPRKHSVEKEADQRETPTVKLKADVQAGFSPLTITFTGRIKDLKLDDDRFCHMGTLLVRKLATGFFETVAGEDPACLHDPDKLEISPTFSIRHVVLDAGSYEFFAMVVTKDGQRIVSNGVPVRVVTGVEN